jgi:probable nitrogen fixation protein
MVESAAGAASPTVANPVLETPFVKELIRQWRAQDAHGAWDGKTDVDLLEPYILDKEKRRRLELFYNAVGLAIERETEIMVSPMMKIHHEGFGRLVLTAGRLIVLNKQLRDVHRFGFDSLEKLSQEGEKLVASAVEMIRKFPEVANY